MDFGQYTGPKQAESRPVRLRFGHLSDFSDSFLPEFSEVRKESCNN